MSDQQRLLDAPATEGFKGSPRKAMVVPERSPGRDLTKSSTKEKIF
tara:strand:- start:603 stop:740 length:138 start_codon:yes stop_codon:yes gene_type:complete